MSESFRVEPDGLYFAIYWGPTLICTEWSTREVAQQHADILEALRRFSQSEGSLRSVVMAWDAFAAMRNRGRE